MTRVKSTITRPESYREILERTEEPGQDDYGISIVANAYGLLQKQGVEEDRFPHCVLTHVSASERPIVRLYLQPLIDAHPRPAQLIDC